MRSVARHSHDAPPTLDLKALDALSSIALPLLKKIELNHGASKSSIFSFLYLLAFPPDEHA